MTSSLFPHESGVYVITCGVTGDAYVGSSLNVRKRWARHKWELSRGSHHSQRLQRAWSKYGQGAFSFILLEKCSPEGRLDLEQRYLDTLSCKYNLARVAGTCEGVRRSTEQIAAISQRMKSLSKDDVAARASKMRSTMSQEWFRRERSENISAQWQNPAIREKRLLALERVRNSSSEKRNSAIRAAFNRPDRLFNHHAAIARRASETNWRANHAASQKARRTVSDETVLRIRKLRADGVLVKEISELTGVKYTTVKNILSGTCYKDVSL